MNISENLNRIPKIIEISNERKAQFYILGFKNCWEVGYKYLDSNESIKEYVLSGEFLGEVIQCLILKLEENKII